MEALCRNYEVVGLDERVPPLLVTATFVFDFLAIHPFRDGNGRVSRLLTTLLLESHSFQLVRFVSLERLVEETKEDYYRILNACSQGWHEGQNDVLPWWNYWLSIVRRGYKEFERQVESASAGPAKGNLVKRTVFDQTGEFTLGELAAQVPGVSQQLIKKILSELKYEGRIRLTGRGRGARWMLQGVDGSLASRTPNS